MLNKRYNKLFIRDICCFDFHSNFLVSISVLLNIRKERKKKSFKRRICCFNFFSVFLDLISILNFLF